VKSARACPHPGRCHRTPCGFRLARWRGDLAPCGAGRRQDGRVRRMPSSPAFPTDTGKRRPVSATPSTRPPKCPTNPAQRRTSNQNTRCRAPSVAVRANADGAHRPS